jgi:CubicO group peptidase (beta-lactamase class C family)
VDPETPFILASVSKSFTAMAVMQLVDAGLVQLDAPVQTYIPWFTVADEGAAAQITVRQLLYQTSGLPTIAGRQQPDPDQSLEASVRALADVSLTTAPGERFQYSNANYNTLGLIVEQVTGQSFGQYVEAQIYAPLEMTHSHVSRAEAEIDGLAAGHRTWFTSPVQETLPYVAADLPSGFLIASAEDMAHYLVAQLNGGQYNGMQVLSAESVAQMHTPPT